MDKPAFNKPLLALYADYLISSFGPTTATGLARLLQSHISYDTIMRFLAPQTLTPTNLWQIVKPLVRRVQNQDAVLVVDDSIAHKPHTEPSELIGWHYDHTTGMQEMQEPLRAWLEPLTEALCFAA